MNGLNPCSDGMASSIKISYKMIDNQKVLILVLMEWLQVFFSYNYGNMYDRLNPCSDGMASSSKSF